MKRIIIVGLLLILTLAFIACAPPKIDGADEGVLLLRYGGQLYPEEFLLKGYDFFREQNLAVQHTLFSSGTENNEALISGTVDVNIGSDSKSVALFNAIGDEALIIGTAQRGNRYSTLVRVDSEYESWQDLKGKTVGTRFGSGAEFVLRKYFDSQPDLAWEDFDWVNLKTEDMIAALDNGQVESFTVWAPTGEIAEAKGIARSIRTYGDVALTPVMLHTTKTYAQNHPDELVAFLAAHLKKAQLIESDPSQAAEYARLGAEENGIDVSKTAFEIVFKRIDFSVDFDQELVNGLTETAEFLKDQGKIDSIPEFYYDRTYIEQAKALIENE